MVKRSKHYRLSDDTLARIAWLQTYYDLDATAIVTMAVAELYENRRLGRAENAKESKIGEKPA